MYLLLFLHVGTCAGKMWMVETRGNNTEAGSNNKVTNIGKTRHYFHISRGEWKLEKTTWKMQTSMDMMTMRIMRITMIVRTAVHVVCRFLTKRLLYVHSYLNT